SEWGVVTGRAIDLFEAVTPVRDLVCRTKQSDSDRRSRRLRQVASAHAEMADGYVPEHSIHQRVQIPAPHDARQVFGEMFFQLGQILAVVIRLVEPIPHDAPGFA